MKLRPKRGWRRLALLLLVVWGLTGTATAQDSEPALTIYVVQRGDSLFSISQQLGVPLDTLVSLNSLADPTRIDIGQRLLVPAAPGTSAEAHVVQPGETVASIAALYGVTPEALATANALTDNLIYIGQTLTLPQSVPAPLQLPTTVFHTVLPGETLFRIAMLYGVTVNEVIAANAISDPSLVYPGQQLSIPGVTPPQLALDLPAVVTGITAQPQVFVSGSSGMIRLQTRLPATVRAVFPGRQVNGGTDDARMSHTLLFGVPLDIQPGVIPIDITIEASDGTVSTLTVNIQVVNGFFITESLSIPEDRLALLAADVDAAEASFIETQMSTWTPARAFHGPMGLPAAAAITSPFGSIRSYNNGVLQRLHLGTDFGGAPGTPIYAPAEGTVLFSSVLEVRGLATLIDHGWGVVSGYWHQTESYVAVGDRVSVGQVIGTIGSSGRVTGPHLHWELWVSSVPVDPMQWVQQSFAP